MYNIPTLHLGQSAANVGAEMAAICATFDWDAPLSLSIDSSLSDTSSSMRCQCSSIFSLPAPGSAFIESVVEKIFSTIESCDSLSTMVVNIDGFGGVGSSLSNALLSELSDILPSVQMKSVFLAPKYDTIQGLSPLNAIMCAQSVLYYSDSVMVRSLDDSMHLCTSTPEVYGDAPSLSNCNSVIASDVLCAHFTGNMTNPSNKIFDVRGSLWKLYALHTKNSKKGGHILKASNAHKKLERYNALRSACVSMRSLDLGSPHSDTYTGHVQPSLGTYWEYAKDQEATVYPSIEEVRNGVRHAVPSMKVRWQLSGARSNARNSDESSAKADKIAAFAFDSVYGHVTLKNVVATASKLLRHGMYVHKYNEESNCGEEDLKDAIENLSEMVR